MSLVDLGKRLLDAAKKGDTEEVRALMSNGAPFTTDWLGTSPLHFAAQNGHLSTAEVLLRAGISRDARTKVDRTPLHVASQEGHITIVELLLRNGADIEAKDMLKMTPLHWSVEKGHIDVVDILVKNGADMNCENKFDKSPLDIAITNGRTDLAQILHLQQNPIVEVVTTDTTETVEEDGLETETVVTEAVSTSSTPVVISPQPVALVANSSIKTATTESTDQSSTSVLATLAALAEATAPLNASNTTSTTAAEALTWLETHGITMISNSDASTAVTSSLEQTGQTLTLTEAGKLALNFVKQQNSGETETIEETVVDGTVEHVEIGNSGTQKVITIVADQGQLEGAARDAPVVVTMATEDVQTEMEAETEGASGEPALKKLRVSDEGLSSGNTSSDQEELRRQLEEVQKQAEEYKQQLLKKEQEAEVYKKQLNEITSKGAGE